MPITHGKDNNYWEQFSKTWEQDLAYVIGDAAIQTYRQFLETRSELGKVLEVGCGTGYFTKCVAENSESIIATDLSEDFIDIAQNNLRDYPTITIRQENVYELSFDDGVFDTVVAINHFCSIEDPRRALEECRRVLRPDGRIVAVIPGRLNPEGYGPAEIRHYEKWGMRPVYMKFWSSEQIHAEFERVGFLGDITTATTDMIKVNCIDVKKV